MTRTTRTAPREGKERWDDFFLLDRAPSLGLNAGLRVTLELLRDVSKRLDFFPHHTLALLSAATGWRRGKLSPSLLLSPDYYPGFFP